MSALSEKMAVAERQGYISLPSEWQPRRWPDFLPAEFICKHTGKLWVSISFLDRLQALRTLAGFAFTITSGYRHETHPDEVEKTRPGSHNSGMGADIQADGLTGWRIVDLAMKQSPPRKDGLMGTVIAAAVDSDLAPFFNIGVQLASGTAKFIHLDCWPARGPEPVMWSY